MNKAMRTVGAIMGRAIGVFLMSLLLSGLPCTGETIHLKNGKVLEGEIVENGTTVELFFSHADYSNTSQTVIIPSSDDSTLKPENENIKVEMGKK